MGNIYWGHLFSVLENPRDGGAWWAAIAGVAQSRTQLKRLSSSSSSSRVCGTDSVQFSRSVVSDSLRPMNRSTPGFPVHHKLPECTQTHVHRVGDAMQPSHPRSCPSAPAPSPSQHQGLFQWVSSSHDVEQNKCSINTHASVRTCLSSSEIISCLNWRTKSDQNGYFISLVVYPK